MTLGERLVHYRKKKAITQKELAEAMGITPTRLNYWEKDKRQPDVEMVRKLAEALDVSADILVGFREDTEIEKSPAPKGTEDREQGINALDIELRSLLLRLGLMPADGDLTAEQVEFLAHIVALIQAYFKK